MLANSLSIPLIVKEIGAGISADVARRLIDVGVKIIDVAGAGGTSWAGVEIVRSNKERAKREKGKGNSNLEMFWDWGIPTVEALKAVCALKSESSWVKVIASGGILSGIDIAKSIAFGADYAAAAQAYSECSCKWRNEICLPPYRRMGMGIERCNVFDRFTFHHRIAKTENMFKSVRSNYESRTTI